MRKIDFRDTSLSVKKCLERSAERDKHKIKKYISAEKARA